MSYFGNDYDTDYTPAPLVKAPRAVPFWFAIVIIPLSAVCAVIIEAWIIARCATSATWETLVVGGPKAAARRRFK